MTSNDKCGTYAGYQAHIHNGSPPCEACRAANRDYTRELRRRNPSVRVACDWGSRTRKRALERLAKEYRARFLELVNEERASEPDPRLARD